MKSTISIRNEYWILIISLFLVTCVSKGLKKESSQEIKSKDILDVYSDVHTETMFSSSVSDSFRIFKSIPNDVSEKKLSLVLILDANAYFESVLSEYKLAILMQAFPSQYSLVSAIRILRPWIR